MKKTMDCRALIAIGLSVLLYGLGCIEVSQSVGGSTQSKKGPTVALPKVRNPSESTGIDSRSFVVSLPAEGEFYVAGQRLTREALASTIRDAFVGKLPEEQKIYVRCGAPLKFGAVRQLLNIIRQVDYETVEFVVEAADSRREAVLGTSIFRMPGMKLDPSDSITLPPRRRETPRSTAPPPPPPPPPPPGIRMRPIKKAIEPPLGALALVVEVRTGGNTADPVVALNRIAMPRPELLSRLSSLLKRRREEKLVFVKPSREITYADLIAVMDDIKGAGADHVWLLIDEVEVPRGIPRA